MNHVRKVTRDVHAAGLVAGHAEEAVVIPIPLALHPTDESSDGSTRSTKPRGASTRTPNIRHTDEAKEKYVVC